jgi:hypothetical protein
MCQLYIYHRLVDVHVLYVLYGEQHGEVRQLQPEEGEKVLLC